MKDVDFIFLLMPPWCTLGQGVLLQHSIKVKQSFEKYQFFLIPFFLNYSVRLVLLFPDLPSDLSCAWGLALVTVYRLRMQWEVVQKV